MEEESERYLRSQAERCLGIAESEIDSGNITKIANLIIYEHRLAQRAMSQGFIPKVLAFVDRFLSGGGNPSANNFQLNNLPQQKILSPEVDSFAANFAAQFED